MKFGFIFETETNVGDNFTCQSKAGGTLEIVMGVKETKDGLMAINKLAEQGIDKFNFCGAFTEEQIKEWDKATGSKYKLMHMNYFEDQAKILDELDSFQEYGVIIINDELKSTETTELNCEACNTTIKFVKDLEAAIEAAKELVVGGIYFIELCSWFDKEKTRAIINAIDSKVPVGTAYPV